MQAAEGRRGRHGTRGEVSSGHIFQVRAQYRVSLSAHAHRSCTLSMCDAAQARQVGRAASGPPLRLMVVRALCGSGARGLQGASTLCAAHVQSMGLRLPGAESCSTVRWEEETGSHLQRNAAGGI
jgi:hypothetical protein